MSNVSSAVVAPAARTAKTARKYSAEGAAKRAAAATARKAAKAAPAPLFSLANATTALPALAPVTWPTFNLGVDPAAPATDPMVAVFGPLVPTASVAPVVANPGKLANGLPALVHQTVTPAAAAHIAYLMDYAARNLNTGCGWGHLATLPHGYIAAVIGQCPTQRAARRRMRAWLAPVAAKHGGPTLATVTLA